MTEDDAVTIATGYMAACGVSYECILSVHHITDDLFDDLRRKATEAGGASPDSEEIGQRMQAKVLSRSYWAVNFKSHWAPGTVESPAGPSVTVYDDTGEAEVFDAL